MYPLDGSFPLRLSITLMHLAWQGAAVVLFLVAADPFLKRTAAQVRYSVNLAAMLAMAACLPATFAFVDVSQRQGSREPSVVTSRIEVALTDGGAAPAMVANDGASVNSNEHGLQLAGRNPVAQSPEPASGLVVEWLIWAAPYLTATYFAGVALAILRVAFGLWGGHQLRRSAIRIDDHALLETVRRQADRIGLKLAPAVAYSRQVSIPVVVGVVKPMILLPAALSSGLSPDQLQLLLTHELAHIRRYDLPVNLLQRLCEAILFFHPAVWFLSRRISIERENVADDMVLAAGWRRVHYADALVRMAELSSASRGARVAQQAVLLAAQQAVLLGASGGSPSNLKRRVLRLLENSNTPTLRLTRSGLLGVVLVALALLLTPIVLRSSTEHAADARESATKIDMQHSPGLEASTRLQSTTLGEAEVRRALVGRWLLQSAIRGEARLHKNEPDWVRHASITFSIDEVWLHQESVDAPPPRYRYQLEVDGDLKRFDLSGTDAPRKAISYFTPSARTLTLVLAPREGDYPTTLNVAGTNNLELNYVRDETDPVWLYAEASRLTTLADELGADDNVAPAEVARLRKWAEYLLDQAELRRQADAKIEMASILRKVGALHQVPLLQEDAKRLLYEADIARERWTNTLRVREEAYDAYGGNVNDAYDLAMQGAGDAYGGNVNDAYDLAMQSAGDAYGGNVNEAYDPAMQSAGDAYGGNVNEAYDPAMQGAGDAYGGNANEADDAAMQGHDRRHGDNYGPRPIDRQNETLTSEDDYVPPDEASMMGHGTLLDSMRNDGLRKVAPVVGRRDLVHVITDAVKDRFADRAPGIWHTSSAGTTIILSIRADRTALLIWIGGGRSWQNVTWRDVPGGILVDSVPRFRFWKTNSADWARVEMEALPPEHTSRDTREFPTRFFMKRYDGEPPRRPAPPLPESWNRMPLPDNWDETAGRRRTGQD